MGERDPWETNLPTYSLITTSQDDKLNSEVNSFRAVVPKVRIETFQEVVKH